jgi:RHS repeat-associated protein
MKAKKRFAWIIALCFEILLKSSFAQVGADSPAGVAGGYNGQISTGCSYDAYTGNATRAITDIVVAGGVGTYPLALTRFANSRYAAGQDDNGNGLNTDFGQGASWLHSYQWSIDSVVKQDTKPIVFTVRYPDGRVIKFRTSTNGDPYFRGGQAIADRLQVFWDNSTSGRAYLILSDGGKVFFHITIQVGGRTGYYTYQLQCITDPYGQTTTITNSPSYVTITEPAGRWLKLHYIDFSGESVIDQVSASDGRSVQYNYGTYTDSGGGSWTVLTSVVYYGDPNLTASYTYQGSGGNPLLKTCIDPMYSGSMWKIAYTFAALPNADGTKPVPGQILSENYFDGTTVGAAVSTLAVTASTTRQETRGDGPSCTFTYASGLLGSWTDYKGAVASQTYDGNGFVKTVTDFHSGGTGGGGNGGSTGGNTTTFQRDPFTSVITQITYPQTPTSCPSCPAGTVKYAYVSPTCSGSNTCDSNNQDTNNEYFLFSATDEAGNTNYLIRDSNKRVTQEKYADTGTESFTYNSFGQVLTHRLATGGLETNTFDVRGLLTQYRDPYHLATADPQNSSVPTSATPTVLYTYDNLDRVATTTDALGSGASDLNHTTSFTYNSRGDITTTTLPVDPVDGRRHTVSKLVDPMTGTVTSVTDQLNHTTSFNYDDYRRVLTTTTPPRFSGDTMNHTSRVYYDANGTGNDYTHTDANVTYGVLPSGKKSAATYDENKRKVSVTAAPGTSDAATTSFGYDLNGLLTSVVSPKEQSGQPFAGQSTTTTYDERHRPYSVQDPLGNVTSCTYDSGGRKKTVTRANGQVATFDLFDAMNRIKQQTAKQTPDPDAVTKYTYLASGLLATMQDPHLVANNSSESYSYLYDLMGRKTQLTYPKPDAVTAATYEQWTYDNGNRNDSFRNRNGNTQRTLFDNLNRPYNVSWDDSGLTPTVTTSYDVASRATAINNANANISHAYFDDGLLSGETTTITGDGVARTVSYTYDADSNRGSIQYPNNAYSFTFDYTNRNQPWHVFNNSAPVATFGYDPDGNLTTRAPDNSTSSSYGYDGLDRLTHIAHALSGTTRTFDYAYDSVSNRKWTKRDNANGDVFGYDLADQSTSVLLNVANPDTTSPGAQTIDYDANGNRTTFSAYGPNDTYATNNLNQYTQRDGVNASYDTKGNMVGGFDASAYTYDAQNRVTGARKASTTYFFAYDALNRQVKRAAPAGVFYNVYDGWNLIAEYSSSSTSPSTAYLGGVKILTTNRYYYQDASGSTSHLADNTGHLLEWYRYDLQGTPIFSGGGNSSAFGVRHLFTGQQWYSELGLYDLRNRFYSPDIGRFLQADPLGFGGGDSNLYRHCGNNPTTYADAFGEIAYYTSFGPVTNIYVPVTYSGSLAATEGPILNQMMSQITSVPGYQGPVTVTAYTPGFEFGNVASINPEPGTPGTGRVYRYGSDSQADVFFHPPISSKDEAIAAQSLFNTFTQSIVPMPLFVGASGAVYINGTGMFVWASDSSSGHGPAGSAGAAGFYGDYHGLGEVTPTSLDTAIALHGPDSLGFALEALDNQGYMPVGGGAVGRPTTVAPESAGAGDGFSGPRVASIPIYATAYKWHAYPTVMVINSGGVKGYYTAIAWSTDPAAYVAPPTTTPRGKPIGTPSYVHGKSR